jgi:insulysin
LALEVLYLTVANIDSFFIHLTRQVIEIFVQGNIYKKDVLKISNLVKTTLKPMLLPQSQWPSARLIAFYLRSFLYSKTLINLDALKHGI